MNAPSTKKSPFIVPVFIPHAGCPHRCIFCNQNATTGSNTALPSVSAVRKAIDEYLTYRKDNKRLTEISFYGGNFLGLPPEQIQLLLATATAYVRRGQAKGIRFSTRPDTIDADRLALIAPFPVRTIEIGVQSMNDNVLSTSRRGHTSEDTRRAMALLQGLPYQVGVQMMVGLPGDTGATALATGRQLASLAPDFVRIYPTLVFRDSALAQWYHQAEYEPLSLDEAVILTADLYEMFRRNDIPVIRMGLQATDDLRTETHLIAGPFHPAFGELVQALLWQNAISQHIGKTGLKGGEVLIEVPPRLLSQVKGQHDDNIIALIEKNSLQTIEVRANEKVPDGTVHVNGEPCTRD